jgi:LDH2 family malate/lactate/ureidoglycolate dehydrogenase
MNYVVWINDYMNDESLRSLMDQCSLSADVAYNSQGKPTTDPMEALKGALRVFDRGHKGLFFLVHCEFQSLFYY